MNWYNMLICELRWIKDVNYYMFRLKMSLGGRTNKNESIDSRKLLNGGLDDILVLNDYGIECIEIEIGLKIGSG